MCGGPTNRYAVSKSGHMSGLPNKYCSPQARWAWFAGLTPVQNLCIFPIFIQHTTMYSFTLFVFRLRLSTTYITTAKIYIMVFYCLFQDIMAWFAMCFPIRCLWLYGCLCISNAAFLVMIFLISAPQPLVFSHIIWDLLGWISGSNMFGLIFLTLFSLYSSCTYERALFYI